MTPRYDWTSLTGLALIALAIVSVVLLVAWWRGGLRHRTPTQRVAALAGLTLFLCFDLVVFGAYTRLSDSGLGCPDWPGCYATSSPLAAAQHIADAQALAPDGPVTEKKAWIEMIHRYFAMALGTLIILMLVAAALARERGAPVLAGGSAAPSRDSRDALVLPGGPAGASHDSRRALILPGLTLAWVVAQGLFGALTVTWKLYPAIVTGHLLGGMGLLALLAVQAPVRAGDATRGARDRGALWLAALALLLQIALGGWVSTNYAVLACTGFPQCNGQWWPAMNWGEGFTFARELGRRADGAPIAMTALVAIQWAHRLFAVAFVAAMGWLVARLWARGPTARRRAVIMAVLVVLQLATGLSNVVLGWPLLAALAHTAGAAALVVCIGFEVAAALNKRIPSP